MKVIADKELNVKAIFFSFFFFLQALFFTTAQVVFISANTL